MTNKALELKQQIAYRQILALSVLGGSMAVLFGALMAVMYLG